MKKEELEEILNLIAQAYKEAGKDISELKMTLYNPDSEDPEEYAVDEDTEEVYRKDLN